MAQFGLLAQRRFGPFFWTQFAGALNDNLFKVAFTTLATFRSDAYAGGVAGAPFLIAALFIAPFLLFSATSGQIADKFDKAAVMRLVKQLEIAILLVAAAGFMLPAPSLLYGCIFLMGCHSTLFGPVKYAYLPVHLAESELIGGNALVESGTFLAILLGTMAGGHLAALGDARWAAAACVALAVAGRIVAGRIPATPAADAALPLRWNPLTETWRNLRLFAGQRELVAGLVGISWLWFVGATFLTALFPFVRDVLGGGADMTTAMLALFSIGMGAGALVCERLSRGRLDLALIPVGAIGMSVFAADVAFAGPSVLRAGADLFLLAVAAGLFSVPLYALIQARSAPSHRARTIAANNILNALFMIVSALLGMALASAGQPVTTLMLVTALLNLAVLAGLWVAMPTLRADFAARLR